MAEETCDNLEFEAKDNFNGNYDNIIVTNSWFSAPNFADASLRNAQLGNSFSNASFERADLTGATLYQYYNVVEPVNLLETVNAFVKNSLYIFNNPLSAWNFTNATLTDAKIVFDM